MVCRRKRLTGTLHTCTKACRHRRKILTQYLISIVNYNQWQILWVVIWNTLIVVRGIYQQWIKSKIGIEGRKSALQLIRFSGSNERHFWKSSCCYQSLEGQWCPIKTSLFKWDVLSLLCPRSWQKNNPTGRIVAGKWKTVRRDERALKRITIQNRFLSSNEICQLCNQSGVQVSHSTTLRRLHSLEYHSRIPLTKPLLNSKQKKRLDWPQLIMSGLLSSGRRWSLVTSRVTLWK